MRQVRPIILMGAGRREQDGSHEYVAIRARLRLGAGREELRVRRRVVVAKGREARAARRQRSIICGTSAGAKSGDHMAA
jgi:hypothetical protein